MASETHGVREVSAEEADELVRAGAWLLDVREHEEFAAGHAPDAVHIPMGELAARVDEVPHDRVVVAICRTGSRSFAVAEALAGAGFDVVNVAGGMRLWAADDLPIVADDGLPGTVV